MSLLESHSHDEQYPSHYALSLSLWKIYREILESHSHDEQYPSHYALSLSLWKIYREILESHSHDEQYLVSRRANPKLSCCSMETSSMVSVWNSFLQEQNKLCQALKKLWIVMFSVTIDLIFFCLIVPYLLVMENPQWPATRWIQPLASSLSSF